MISSVIFLGEFIFIGSFLASISLPQHNPLKYTYGTAWVAF